jgi:hypothetical protein
VKKTKLDDVVTYKTPFLAEVVIKSFRKFCPSDIELRFVFVENSDFDLSGHLERVGINGLLVTTAQLLLPFLRLMDQIWRRPSTSYPRTQITSLHVTATRA